MIPQFRTGIVIDVYLSDSGAPLVSVLDNHHGVHLGVSWAMQGGGFDRYQYFPLQAPEGSGIVDETRVGSEVLLMVSVGDFQNPYIVAVLSSPKIHGERITDEIELSSDGQHPPGKHQFDHAATQCDGSAAIFGSNGATLDTQVAKKPIRLQVPSDQQVRISQTDQDTIDHIVLASVLLPKLDVLEAAVLALQAQVAANTAKLGSIAATGIPHTHSVSVPHENGALVGGTTGQGAPDVGAYAPPVVTPPTVLPVPLFTGAHGTLRADCVRLSNKSTGE